MRFARLSSALLGALLFTGAGPAKAAPSLSAKVQTEAAQGGSDDKYDETLPPTVDEAAFEHARMMFGEGAAAYEAGRYPEAIDKFLVAASIYPNPQFSFNVAKAYDQLGDTAGALRFYREYLKQQRDAPDRETVQGRVRELELGLSRRGIQQLAVTSKPSGATLLIDGRPVGVTPWVGETWPGKHRLALRQPGYRDAETEVVLSRHRALDVALQLEARPKPSAQRPAGSISPRPSGRIGMLTWGALGIGVVGLGGALLSESASDQSGISRTSAFFAGVSTMAFAAGGTLLYLDLRGASAPGSDRAAAATDELRLGCWAAGCNVQLAHAF
ncbi:MAG: PEGA domain-containing protein [Polyangiaceae bacterium]